MIQHMVEGKNGAEAQEPVRTTLPVKGKII